MAPGRFRARLRHGLTHLGGYRLRGGWRSGFLPVLGGFAFKESRSMRGPGSTSTRSATLTFRARAIASSVSSDGFRRPRSTSAK